jgi:formamidopyrimidine-DNA glycosylase
VPELPDITVYLEALGSRIVDRTLEQVRLGSPFVLRSVSPTLQDCAGLRVTGLQRLGKRIVFGLEREFYLVIHLMIAGRLRWKTCGARLPGKAGLAAFDFDSGTLLLTEAGSKKRAALHVVHGREELQAHDPGGLEVLSADAVGFKRALLHENHTVKRSLTDPRILSGIGNAYSDEILHRARMSPFKQTRALNDEEMVRLFEATRATLEEWTDRLRRETGDGFPAKVTAFRDEMAVHGRYRKPCPDCGSPVQRIVYSGNEANYCAVCQTGGRLLADRALSRLLKNDWPRTIEELENRR